MPSGDAMANSSRLTLTMALYRSSSLALGLSSRKGARLMPGPIHTRLLSFEPSNSSTPWCGLSQWMPSSLSAYAVKEASSEPRKPTGSHLYQPRYLPPSGNVFR